MTDREPELLEKYIPGVDPAKRPRHRGFMRSFYYYEYASTTDVTEYINYVKRKHSGDDIVLTRPIIGDIEADGFYYFYMDEYASQSDSMQEAASILKRNRSTLNAYTKDPTFPYVNNIDKKKTIDIIAAQDWILWNTDHHSGLEPYWPTIEENVLITMAVEESKKEEPLFRVYNESDLKAA